MNEYFGKTVIITDEVVYVGKGENPEDNFGYQIWKKSLENWAKQIKENEKQDLKDD